MKHILALSLLMVALTSSLPATAEEYPKTVYLDYLQRFKQKRLIERFKYRLYPYNYEVNDTTAPDCYIDDIFAILPNLKPKDGEHLLAYLRGNYNDYRHELSFEIPTEANKDDAINLSAYIQSDFSPESIWQMFLLENAWCTAFPLGWHFNYQKCQIITETGSVTDEGSYTKDKSEPVNTFVITDEYLPYVTYLNEDTALLSVCLWNDWRGLYQVTIPASHIDGCVWLGSSSSDVPLLKYYSGIRF